MNWEIAGYIVCGILCVFGFSLLFEIARQEIKKYRREKEEKAYWENRIRRLRKKARS